MPSNSKNDGAEEQRRWERKIIEGDAAFHAAMEAAGYKLVTIDYPQTCTVRMTPHQPAPISRGSSPAAMCAEQGSAGKRGGALNDSEVY
jgi:hypothetical protein